MTTEVKERVVTEFEISDKATGHIAGMQGAFSELGGAINGTISQMFNLKTVIAGVVGGLGIHKIIEVGAAFEATQTQLAGFLQVQKMVPTFNAGLETAATTMGALNKAAAVLSGTTEEYTGVFLQAFSNVRKATGGSIEDVYTFTNKMTAVGKAFKLESTEIGRQLTALLAPGHGMAGMHNILFQRMLSSMQQLKGQANLTSASFNAMTQKERFVLLSKTVGQFDDMIKATSHSWEAMAGTFKSDVRIMTRLATANVFEGLKNGLGHVNDMLMDSQGHLTEFAQGIVNAGTKIGNYFVNGTIKAIDALKSLRAELAQSTIFAEGRSMVHGLFGGVGHGLGGAAERMRARGAEHGGAGIMAGQLVGTAGVLGRMPGIGGMISHIPGIGALAGLGPLGGAIIPIAISAFQTLAHNTTAVTEIFQGVRRVAGTVMDIFSSLTNVLASVGESLGTLAAVILPQLLGFFGDLVSTISTLVIPILGEMASAMSSFSKWVADNTKFERDARQVNPDFRTRTTDEIDAIVGKAQADFFKEHHSSMPIDQINDMGLKLGREFIEAEGDQKSKIADYEVQTDRLMAMTVASGAAAKAATAAAAAPPEHRGGGGRAVQDFRYSRFEIQQKFAEGYDPDRIAVAFAKDVGRIGEMKLQSAHEPLYSTH